MVEFIHYTICKRTVFLTCTRICTLTLLGTVHHNSPERHGVRVASTARGEMRPAWKNRGVRARRKSRS